MSTISSFLSTDHRACDQFFADAESAVSRRDWATARDAGNHFLAAMAHHFRMEEEVLFPKFEDATGMQGGPPAMMRIEHEQMRELLSDLGRALVAADRDAYLGASETLLVLMQQHNMKEEHILYPMTERVLSPTVVDEMASVPRA